MKNSKNANDGELSRAMELLMNGSVSKTQIEYIFPEFDEYYDQRMRKAISCIVKSQKEQQIHMDGENGIKYDDMISWLEDKCENEKEKEDDADFIVYHPLKNGKGEYESIPYSFYGSLTAFSEDKDLVDFLRTCFYTEEECDEWIKSQNNCYTDNTITKFKVGDWIVTNTNKSVYQITEIPEDYKLQAEGQYRLCSYEDNTISYCWKDDLENECRPWTIQDAKAGDVLFQDLMCGKTFIYNGVNPDMAILYSFIISNDGKDVLPYHIGKPNTGIGTIEENKNIIHPATREQRELLFRKMNEQGYEWDTENKRLK